MQKLCGLVMVIGWMPALCSAAEITFENARLKAVLGDDAAWRSVVSKATGREFCPPGRRAPMAAVHLGSRFHPADRASMADGRLSVKFDGCDTELIYSVVVDKDWILFRLDSVGGARPKRAVSAVDPSFIRIPTDSRMPAVLATMDGRRQADVEILRLETALTRHVGPRLTAAWDERDAICLRAVNMQTDGIAAVKDGVTELVACTQDGPGPRLEGSAAALIAAPKDELGGVLHRLAVEFKLPHNDQNAVPSKNLPTACQSYWFLTFGEQDAERVVRYCRQTGITQVMMTSWSWCVTPGHYDINTRGFPDGLDSLRRTVKKLHDAGLLVGLHCFASKVAKRDGYVTPTPDHRFWVDRSAAVADDIDASATDIRTDADLREWPGSSVAHQKAWEGGVACHQDVVIDDEIIHYRAIGPEGKWNTFLGCTRGFNGTKPASHKAGVSARHFGVDGCVPGYIIDQETTLLDETTTRLADVFNACDFDMVYFDGGEDVIRPRFNYYVSKFQTMAIGKFHKRPLIHMGTLMTHYLWHSFTRAGTVDVYSPFGDANERPLTVKGHIDRSVRYATLVNDDMTPGELGWFGIWPKKKRQPGLQLDEIEYLMVKSLAYDAPISLSTAFHQMDAHPLTPGILQIVRVYEQLRCSGVVDAKRRERLAVLGKDYVLVPSGDPAKPADFVEVQALTKVAGQPDLRAWAGTLGDDAIVTLWHESGRRGQLAIACDNLAAADIEGHPIPLTRVRGETVVPLGPTRALLRFPKRDIAAVAELLAGARCELSTTKKQ
jgi:hypothetical protein